MFLNHGCSDEAVLVTWDAWAKLLFVVVSDETCFQIMLLGQHHLLTARILLIASADSDEGAH